MLGHALAFADRGWPVFPLEAGSKTPSTSSGFRAATLDSQRIADWWRIWPHANIGISTGPAALLVIDCDTTVEGSGTAGVVDGADAFCEFSHRNGLGYPDTYTVSTPSGGLHFYFRVDVEVPCSTSRVGWHVDVRANGGYVVAAGSTLLDAGYDLLNDVDPIPAPAWLVERASPARPSALWGRHRPPRAPKSSDRYLAAATAAETAAVASAPAGRRNDQLNRSAFALARFVVAGDLDASDVTEQLAGAALEAGLSPTEVERTLRSALTAR